MSGIAHGGCRCGAIRYRVTGPATWSVGCCCRDCARIAGAPFVVMVGFPPEAVSFETEPDRYESSPGVIRGFCPTCRSHLSYARAQGFEAGSPILYLMAPSLDAPDLFPPSEVVWYAERPGWFALHTDIPCHAGVSDINAERSYATVMARRAKDGD